MNWKRIGRLLVCLVLVCVILVNCSPIRAQALEPVTTALAAGTVVLAAALIGLGISAGDNADAFVDVVQRLSTHEKILPYLDADGNIHISRFGLEDGQLSPWLIPAVLLQVIRQVLFDEEVISVSTDSDNWTYGDLSLSSCPSDFDITNFPYLMIFRDIPSGDTRLIALNGRLRFSPSLNQLKSSNTVRWRTYNHDSGGWSLLYASSNSSFLDFDLTKTQLLWTNFNVVYVDEQDRIYFVGSDPVQGSLSVADGLTAGEIAPLQQELTEGYPIWGQGQIQDQDENYWMPIGLDQTLEETMRLTQQQVQLGEGTFEQTQDQEQEQTQIPGLIQGFQDKVNTWFSRLSLNQLNILDLLGQIPELIVSPVVQALEYIFVPSQDFLTDKVQTLRQEFVFADTLITGGQMIGDAFIGFDTSPPIIYIDLGATRGDYDIGGKVPFIDLTWYEEYKPTVDMLLSSFLWVVFIWKLFQKAPGIISGMPGDFVMEGLQSLNMDVYLPMRSQSHEKVRRLNRRSKL